MTSFIPVTNVYENSFSILVRTTDSEDFCSIVNPKFFELLKDLTVIWKMLRYEYDIESVGTTFIIWKVPNVDVDILTWYITIISIIYVFTEKSRDNHFLENKFLKGATLVSVVVEKLSRLSLNESLLYVDLLNIWRLLRVL